MPVPSAAGNVLPILLFCVCCPNHDEDGTRWHARARTAVSCWRMECRVRKYGNQTPCPRGADCDDVIAHKIIHMYLLRLRLLFQKESATPGQDSPLGGMQDPRTTRTWRMDRGPGRMTLTPRARGTARSVSTPRRGRDENQNPGARSVQPVCCPAALMLARSTGLAAGHCDYSYL